VKAGVAWYGKLIGERDALRPKFPLDVIEDLKAPVLGLYGGLDQGITLASIGQMRSALLASKNAVANRAEFHLYPEAGHAFAADYRPSYRKADAEDGFKRLHAWLKAHGAG
jgi:carboxymethylenebutenolidase